MIFSGVLGKRTKWQEKGIAQLCLDIKFKNERDEYSQKLTFTSKNLPKVFFILFD